MKKITCFFFIFIFTITSFASSFVVPEPNAKDVMIPLFGSDQKISLAKYVKLTPAEYKDITGKKLGLKERISFKISQRYLKKSISKDGTVNIEKLNQLQDEYKSFNIGWFALGFFLGLIGLIIALLINDEKRKGRIRWVLWGLGAAVALFLLLHII